ncbi:hypothetical protein HOY82DRAFT_558713 [Tuber indicum]|nr:hypothetical protein HOY82DRAFT_558713 [Tuber indicum]
MSDFGDHPSHLPWREQRLERDTPSVLPQEQEGHQAHTQLPPVYEQYSPPGVSEAEDDYRDREWPTSHEGHGSPHSQTSNGSMIESPHSSSHHSEHRHSVDIAGQPSHGEHHMSLSERRQEKRKMKRFRLTHNQTRFLMSEFARQAHPDAAHRERLAREIPGLSPRQVQVWFQNRRAKLKRMSSDDRERMMKSRALPDEFPILQTLQYGGGRMMGTPIASPTEYSPTASMAYRTDPLRRRHLGEDEVVVSPTTPGFPGLSFTPTTTSGDLLSPASSTGERSSFLGFMTAPLGPQQQRGNPFSRPRDPFRSHPSVPRLQLQDIPRSMAESASSPLRSSTPYSANTIDHSEYQLSPSTYSMQGMSFNEPPRSVPPETPQSPFVHTPQGPYTHPYPSPAPASAHQTRPPPSFPPPLTLPDYKYPQPPLTPHSGTMSGFATAPLVPPQEFQIPQMSASADATTPNPSYLARGSDSIGSATALGAPPQEPEERRGRISLLGREFGHQRKRSSSHPPNFPQNREP